MSNDILRVSHGVAPAYGEILILNPPGVSQSSSDGIKRVLAEYVNNRGIEHVDPSYFTTHFKPIRTSLVVIPGGIDGTDWGALIGDIGMHNLHNYTKNCKGRILTFCKGTYFACRISRFNTGGLKIEHIRELYLLSAEAKGPYRSPSAPTLPTPTLLEDSKIPVVRTLSSSSPYLTETTAIKIIVDSDSKGYVLMNNGPSLSKCRSLARYADDEEIAIGSSEDNGVVASCVHPEILPSSSSPLFERMVSPENQRFLKGLWAKCIFGTLFDDDSDVLNSPLSYDDGDDRPPDLDSDPIKEFERMSGSG